jgi:hypothetical protein
MMGSAKKSWQLYYDNAQGWQTNVAGGVALIGKIHVNDQKHEETQPWWEINMGEFANDPMFETIE